MRRQTFGSRLQEIREMRGISRRDLAARTQLKASYLEKIERGYNAPPSALAIADIAKTLKVDADELFLLSGRISPEIERLLKTSPSLLLLVRLGQEKGADWTRSLLAQNGVSAEKLEWEAVDDSALKADERRSWREPVTTELRRAVFHKDGGECVYCSAVTLLEVDHIQPVSVGGTNDIENLVTCCERCNKKKGNRTTPFIMVFGRFRGLSDENA